MRTRVRTVTSVTLFAVAVGLIAFVGGRSGGTGLVKLPVGSAAADETGDAAASTAMAGGRSMISPAYGGAEYRLAGDLPSLPSTAAAYRLRSDASTADVERLARALGLDGPVREVDRAFAVRDGNRELRVERDVPGLPWYLGITCEDVARPEPAGSPGTAVTPDGCEVAVSSGVAYAEPAPAVAVAACPPDAPDCAASVTGSGCEPGTRCLVDPAAPAPTAPCDAGATCPAPTEPAPMPAPAPAPEPPPRPADLPSRAEAERIARETFTRLGAPPDGFAMEDGWITWEARVEPRLDGVEVMGMAWWLGVGSGGRIVHGGGMLATTERIGDYPLAGVEAGVRRLNEGFGGYYRTMTAGAGTDEGGVADDVASSEEEELRAAEERKLSEEGAPAEQRRQGETAGGGSGQSGGGHAPAGQAGGTPVVDLPSPVVDCPDPNVSCGPPVTVEPVPAPGTVPVPEKVVLDVTGVRLVLLQLDGMLVPSYVFGLAGGGESPPVPAVTDEWLDAEEPGVERVRR